VDREQVLFRLFGKYCPEGTILATAGAPGDEVSFVQSGAVRLGEAHGPGSGAALLGPGDLLGAEAFFRRAPRTARAEAVRDTRLIQVNDRSLDAVVRHGPQTARQIAERLLAEADRARRELTDWTAAHILGRVASQLTAAADGSINAADLAERSGTVEADVGLVLEELARRGGLAREGAAYRAPDPGMLERTIDELLSRGGA
jgi:CRP-like cAMP-binding protein